MSSSMSDQGEQPYEAGAGGLWSDSLTSRPGGERSGRPPADAHLGTQRPVGAGTERPGAAATSRPRPASAAYAAYLNVGSSGATFAPGTRLVIGAGELTLVRLLARSGEAEVYEAKLGGQRCAFKYYHPAIEPDREILERWSRLRHPSILRIIDYGTVGGRSYELSEFAEGGTLADAAPIRDPDYLRDIVWQVVEGLAACHEQGIVHRDIKPANLFFRDPGRKSVAVGDLGIASKLQADGRTAAIPCAQTMHFAAPEQHREVDGRKKVSPAVDYYALGITILALWLGHSPFEGLTDDDIVCLKEDGKVPIPPDMPRDWRDLVQALLAVAPSMRLDVHGFRRWLRGEKLDLSGILPTPKYKPFLFGHVNGRDLVAHDPTELAELMLQHREQGIRHLYKHTIAEWLKEENPGLYVALRAVVEDEYPRNKDAGFTKAIYLLDPSRPFIGLGGVELRDRRAVARHFEENFDHYAKDLAKADASFYLYLEAHGYNDQAQAYRELFKQFGSKALNRVIFHLEGGTRFVGPSYELAEPAEILDLPWDEQWRLAMELADPDSKLSIWLEATGLHTRTIDIWRGLSRRDPESLRYALGMGPLLADGTAPDSPESVRRRLLEDPESIAGRAAEVDEWLRHYQGTDLPTLCREVLAGGVGELADPVPILECAALGWIDGRMRVADVLDAFLPHIRAVSSARANVFEEAARRVGDSLRSWVLAAPEPDRFVDRLEEFVRIVTERASRAGEFCRALVREIDRVIPLGFAGDLARCGGQPDEVDALFAARDRALAALGKLVPNLHAARIAAEEERRLEAERGRLEQEVHAERLRKEAAILSRRRDRIRELQQTLIDSRRPKLRRRLIRIAVALSFVVIGLVLLLGFTTLTADQVHWGVWVSAAIVGGLLGWGVGAALDEDLGGTFGCLGLIMGLGIVYAIADQYLLYVAAPWLFYELLRFAFGYLRLRIGLMTVRLPRGERVGFDNALKRAKDWEVDEKRRIMQRRRAELAVELGQRGVGKEKVAATGGGL